MFYRLVRINASDGKDESSWTLTLPTTIGRNDELEVCIVDESISRAHCQLMLGADEALMVRDLGSTNGTYVNGDRVHQAHTLVPGDILQIGSINLRVEYKSDTDPGPLRPKKTKVPMTNTQPMRTIPQESFDSFLAPAEPVRWWEFWKKS